jgi:hypothetical protein
MLFRVNQILLRHTFFHSEYKSLEGCHFEVVLLDPRKLGECAPPGETFCCPPHGAVNGSICINGSVPKHVLEFGEDIVLEVVNGKLISWSAVGSGTSSKALDLFEEQKRAGAANGDDNSNTFAELGTLVRRCTGGRIYPGLQNSFFADRKLIPNQSVLALTDRTGALQTVCHSLQRGNTSLRVGSESNATDLVSITWRREWDSKTLPNVVPYT